MVKSAVLLSLEHPIIDFPRANTTSDKILNQNKHISIKLYTVKLPVSQLRVFKRRNFILAPDSSSLLAFLYTSCAPNVLFVGKTSREFQPSLSYSTNNLGCVL